MKNLLKVTPTPFIRKSERMIWLQMTSQPPDTADYSAILRLNYNRPDYPDQCTAIILTYPQTTLFVADTPTPLTLSLDFPDQTSISTTIAPTRKWTVKFITSSHEDLGYCAYAHTLQSELADMIDQAMDLADDLPGYRFLIEHCWWLQGYQQYRTRSQQDKLCHYLTEGKIGLGVLHSGVHTSWHGYEQLARSVYFGRRYARDYWGIDARTGLIADISGVTWPAVNIFADSGIDYLALLPNKWRNQPFNQDFPRLFRWKAPGSSGRWLLCHRQDSYWYYPLDYVINQLDDMAIRKMGFSKVAVGDSLFPQAWKHFYRGFGGKEELLEQYLAGIIAENADFPGDCLPVYYYIDHECPNPALYDIAAVMAERWEWPKFSMGLPDQCYQYIVDHFTEQIPEFSGNITDQWADFAVIDPVSQRQTRHSKAMLPVCETLATLATVKKRDFAYPAKQLADSWWRLSMYDEHCWSTGLRVSEMNVINSHYVKRLSAQISSQHTELMLKSASGALSRPDGMAVWNFLPRPRQELVTAAGMLGQRLTRYPHQRLDNGTVLAGPMLLPAGGAVSLLTGQDSESGSDHSEVNGNYRPAIKTTTTSSAVTAWAEISNTTVTTPYYQLDYNRDGQIVSLLDRQSQRQLLDSEAKYRLGDLLYVQTPTRESNQLQITVADSEAFYLETGALALIFHRTARESASKAVTKSTITFYKDSPDLDICLTYSQATGLLGGSPQRYRGNIFFALPLFQENPRFFSELAGCVVDEKSDYLPINSHDFQVIQHFIAVEAGESATKSRAESAGLATGAKEGIALFSREAIVFHLGGIYYNLFTPCPLLSSSHVYLYAAGNRQSGILPGIEADCQGEFHLSMRSYQGGWRDFCPEWSSRKLYPPLVLPGSADFTGIEIDQPNVRLLTLKKAENSGDFILRLAETAGRDSSVTVRLPFDLISWQRCSVCEDLSGEFHAVTGNQLQLSIAAFDCLTIAINVADTTWSALTEEVAAESGESSSGISTQKSQEMELIPGLAFRYSASAVFVIWEQPRESDGILDHYRICRQDEKREIALLLPEDNSTMVYEDAIGMQDNLCYKIKAFDQNRQLLSQSPWLRVI